MILMLLVFGYIGFRSLVHSPEELLVGQWSERSWEYDRVCDKETKDKYLDGGIEEIQIGSDEGGLLLHEYEDWTFLPNGNLHIKDSNNVLHVYKWCLKGRGDILVVKNRQNEILEHYKIGSIDRNEMVLNFELDIQVKGLARLTFKKV